MLRLPMPKGYKVRPNEREREREDEMPTLANDDCGSRVAVKRLGHHPKRNLAHRDRVP